MPIRKKERREKLDWRQELEDEWADAALDLADLEEETWDNLSPYDDEPEDEWDDGWDDQDEYWDWDDDPYDYDMLEWEPEPPILELKPVVTRVLQIQNHGNERVIIAVNG